MRMVVHRPELAIRLFGNFAMEVDGEPFVMATPRRTLPILAYLLLNRGTAVSREFLAYFMWPVGAHEAARKLARLGSRVASRAGGILDRRRRR
jgi:DNA-binding SARP family transcriptional activator